MIGDPVQTEIGDGRSLSLHGSAIVIGDLGILVLGPARSGKSSLCLSGLRRAASMGLVARLVADDHVRIDRGGDGLRLHAPDRLFGRIEVSGIGILKEPAVKSAPFGLAVELCDPEGIERLPQELHTSYLGSDVRRIRLPARQSAFGADVLVTLAVVANRRDEAGD